MLSLRGEGVTAQPLTSPDGRLILAWNGQIFDWDTSTANSDHATSSKVRLDSGANDGLILLDRIQHLLADANGGDGAASSEQAINAALAEVEGPYAFVLLDRLESRLYFGRDPLGRRSLLLYRSPSSRSMAITSVASRDLLSLGTNGTAQEATLSEVPCSSLWSIDLLHDPISPQPVQRHTSRFTSPFLLKELRQPSDHPDELSRESSPSNAAEVRAAFLSVLSESVRRRVTNINTDQPVDEAHVAVLFSGGLDCTTLALLADRYVPLEQPIDLLNVGFENVRAIEAAKHEKEKRLRAKLKAENAAANKIKQRNKAQQFRNEIPTSESGTSAATMEVEPQSTEKTDHADDGEEEEDDIYAVPDRLTGIASYRELCRLAPRRRWNFVEINVPYVEYNLHRSEVESLMSPTASVMDLSIGSALYFASRAIGQIRPSPLSHLSPSSSSPSSSSAATSPTEAAAVPYTSPGRVLISGLGADELLGGYSRHRQAYARPSSSSSPSSSSALTSLTTELQLDLDRLPTRNLGRDDRILSIHSKEARYPFLDRNVIDCLTSIPIPLKIDLDRIAIEGAGGDKRLLRDLAKFDLGLQGASELKKRAMQFGTRSAKIDPESRNVKGHHKLQS